MENRLIYFAMPAEKMENMEAGQAAVGDGESDLKKSAQTLEKLQKLESAKKLEGAEAKKNSAMGKADVLLADGNISEGAKKILSEKKKACSNQADATKLAAAVKDLEAAVDYQTKRLPENIGKLKELEGFGKIPEAAKLFASITIAGSNLRGLPKPAEFKMLDSKQKDSCLKQAREIVSKQGNLESANAVEALRDKLLSNPDLPDTWRAWLKDPKSGGGKPEEQTLAYAATWVNKNVGEMQLSTIRYESFKSANQDKLSKSGVILRGKAEFQKLSRGERNEYLDKMRGQVGKVDKGLADKMQAATVSDGVKAKGKSVEMHDSAKKAEEGKEAKAATIAEKIKHSPLRARMETAIAKKTAEAKKDTSADDASRFANLRMQHASGEKPPSVLGKVISMFGKKKAETKTVENDKDTGENAARKSAINGMLKNENPTKGEAEKTPLSKADAEGLDDIFGKKSSELPPDKIATLLEIVSANPKELDAKLIKEKMLKDRELAKLLEEEEKLGKAAEETGIHR